MSAGRSDRACLSELRALIIAEVDLAGLMTELLPVRRVGRELSCCCPFHDDRTPSFSANAETGIFFCHGCGAKGDIFDLVGHVWGVVGFLDQLVAVARWGGLTWALDRLEGRDARQSPFPAPRPMSKAAIRKAVDRDEVATLWSQCCPVTNDAAVSDYLSGRGLDPIAIADRDLARALPELLTLPSWASCRRVPWNRSGHRLLVRLFDAQGQLASLTVRRIVAAEDGVQKALFPPGPRGGLLLADDAGRWVLRAPHDYMPTELWVAEGVTDHLALACDFVIGDESAPGALAIVGPKSWSKEVADRIPDGVVVVVAVDADEAGDRYIDEIVQSFAGRQVRIDRWMPKQERGAS